MRAFAQGLLAGSLFALAACSTVDSRIQENPGAYASLSPADKQLVRSGQVREGLPQAAVYIAWGRPDRIRHGVRQGVPFEAWVYTQIQSIYAPSYYPQFYRFGLYRYSGYWGGFPYYGPFYDPFLTNFIDIEVPYKTAFFEGNRCTGWEYIR
jgi:hypothetical protein